MTSGKADGAHLADDPQVQIDQSAVVRISFLLPTLKLADAADRSTEKRKAERNRRKKLNARKNKAEKARQEFEERQVLGSASQYIKISLSIDSGKTSKSLASDCFDGTSGIDCFVESSALAQEKTGIYFSNAMFEIKTSPGKGLGVFAAQDIKKETKILREAPLMKCGVNWLLKEALFMSLNEEKNVLGPFTVIVAATIPHAEKQHPSRFTELIASISSATNRNAQISFTTSHHALTTSVSLTWLEETLRMEILVFSAVRNIKRGEELTTLYQAPLGTTLARRKFLSSKYGFICMCKACINNKVLILHSESLKYAPWIVAKESGSEILNKPTLEEIQTLKQVESWYESVSQAAEKAGQCVTIAIGNDLLQS
ncbi:hypothetical protein BOTNAR_0383g00060 [Botryotinia narcissicola]|uniref:SET domain-containing protein n=1 Tax=Botryotinia narcissicola TaxID=278944 RepID=A0A4Z1I1N8_9HELO|nr:hypothetical protein BOTNAR_0383g00060 [Botryotinia narcissicola]